MSNLFTRIYHGVHLTPQVDFPLDATEGDLCYKTDHKLYIYVSADWQEVAFE